MKQKQKTGRGKFVFLCILTFSVFFSIGIIGKLIYKPAWAKKYNIEWREELGELKTDIAYGDGEANKFDLYLPKDSTKGNYGLVVYLHAGGFTTGDKADDRNVLAWLCSKGYVAAGINYTLRTEDNNASVLTQSNEIKVAIPVVIEKAKEYGYDIDRLAMAGGSAGGALAMIYSYRDAKESPVPIKLMFEMVGPSSFHVEDWGIYGLDQNSEAAANLFGIMAGVELTPEMIESGEYQELMTPISAYKFITPDSVPSILLYGTEDRFQPYNGVRHLENALKENHVDYKLFVAPHSGHGVQNDDAVFEAYMKAVEEYLDKYMQLQ